MSLYDDIREIKEVDMPFLREKIGKLDRIEQVLERMRVQVANLAGDDPAVSATFRLLSIKPKRELRR